MAAGGRTGEHGATPSRRDPQVFGTPADDHPQHLVTLTLNPALDATTDVPALIAGRKLRCGPVRREAGGGGINVARAITALGGRARALFAAGGPIGDEIDRHLADEGVPRRMMAIGGTSRENIAVTVRDTGELVRLVMPGPRLTRSEWRRCLDAAADAAEGPWLVASGSLPPGVPDDAYGRLARALARRGVRLLLDTAGRGLRGALSSGVQLAKPNYLELDELAGRTLDEDGREEFAASIVASGGADVVIVTLGGAGALVVCAGRRVMIPAPRIAHPESAVGAGDNFMAALALGLLAGSSPPDASVLGVAAAAAALLTPGTAPCRRADLEAMLIAMDCGGAVAALPATVP
jgi:6-phosphofructokinase 2